MCSLRLPQTHGTQRKLCVPHSFSPLPTGPGCLLGSGVSSVLLPIDENCKDKYYNCNVVVQARLCVYNYYKTACCVSCTRVANRHTGFLGSR